jgi:hypothetical protein
MPDLNLGDVLTEEELRHYQRFLGSTATIFVHPRQEQSWQWTATVVTSPPGPSRGAVLAELQERPTRDGILLPAGHGPDAATSCTGLARSPGISWDVCGYYARLGVPWTATKRQIKEALLKYQATIGAGDAALIYAAKQLLDDGIRRRYDQMPLGGLFLEDKDVVARLKAAALRAASAMAARGYSQMTPEDVLGSWGYSVTPGGGPQGEERERTAPPPAPPPRTGDPLGLVSAAHWLTRWTWYREPDVTDWYGLRPGWLEAWQRLLIAEFARRGMTVRFAVGLTNAGSFAIRTAPDPRTLVVLLGEGEPSPELAAAAVDAWGPATQALR